MIFLVVTNDEFKNIFRKYSKYVFSICKNIVEYRVGKTDFPFVEIEEITQITFIKLFKYLKKIDTVNNMKALISRISELTTISYLDKYISEKDNVVSYEELSPNVGSDATTDIVLNNDSLEQLVELIKSLDKKYSAVILLKYVHEMSLKDIAFVSGIPYNTVCSWHARGKKLLAEKLEQGYESYES